MTVTTDPLFQFLPALSSWDYDRLKRSIATHGLFDGHEPEVDEDGRIIDGHHRAKVCAELGITFTPRRRLGLTDDEKWDRAYELNVSRRHLNPAERRQLLREYLSRHPDRSDRAIAQASGTSDKTVASVRAEMVASAEIPHLPTVGLDGRTRDFTNRAETREAMRIQAVDFEDDRTPVDAADHRNITWVSLVYGYSAPASDVRVRGAQPHVRETERREYQTGVIDLTRRAPQTSAEARAAATEIGDALYRAWLERPLLTMDPEATAWR